MGSLLPVILVIQKKTGYWITTRSFPYRGPYWPGPIWASTSSQANMGVIFTECENMCSLLPVILVIQKCLYLNYVCNN
jgi:hypothetical protein